jgi:acetyltransferase
LRQAGTILVERSDEIFEVADALSRARGRAAKRVAVLSEGGGPISQAADALAGHGLLLPRVAEGTEAQLKKITPAATQLFNPVDLPQLPA